MKLYLLIITLFLSSLLFSQTDSSIQICKNSVDVELLGSSLLLLSKPAANFGYTRFFPLKKSSTRFEFEARIGYGTGTKPYTDTVTYKYSDKRIQEIPFELGAIIGERKFKFQIGISYVGVWGKQSIMTRKYFHNGPPAQYVYVSYYDYFNMKFGIAYFPSNKYHFPYVCLALVPTIIPSRNPVTDPEDSYFPPKHPRFIPFWAGLTLGLTF